MSSNEIKKHNNNIGSTNKLYQNIWYPLACKQAVCIEGFEIKCFAPITRLSPLYRFKHHRKRFLFRSYKRDNEKMILSFNKNEYSSNWSWITFMTFFSWIHTLAGFCLFVSLDLISNPFFSLFERYSAVNYWFYHSWIKWLSAASFESVSNFNWNFQRVSSSCLDKS